MKFTTGVAMVDSSFYLPIAEAAEAAGFDVLTLSDSIGYPQTSDTKYPYNGTGDRTFLENKPFLEPMVAVAAIAARTSRIQLCPAVLKLPVRHPVLFAKQATSVAVLSDNRFLLGAGTSPWPDDYDLVGLPWERRGRRFEECVEILRGLETGDYFEFHGAFYDFEAVKLNPVPTEPIPLIVGGISDALIDRAARIGDGWLPTGLPPDRMAEAIERIHRLRAEYGRDHLPFAIFGAAAANVEQVEALEALGITHVMANLGGTFNPYGQAPDTEPLADKLDRIRRFGDEVIAAFR